MTKKAFEVLNAMREFARQDTRPRFQECEITGIGRCRFRRYEPEVLFNVRRRLAEEGITSSDTVPKLADNDRARAVCLWALQRAIVSLDSASLTFREEANERLTALLSPDVAEMATKAMLVFQEIG